MSDTKRATEVQCPSCATAVAWTKDNAFRPFCSESCKNKDFIDWANEHHRMDGSSVYNDVFSEELAAIPPQDSELH